MKQLILCLFLFFAIAFSQIPEFDIKEEFSTISGKGSMCFAKWDSDDLVDILWVKGARPFTDDTGKGVDEIVFYKNIGTETLPKFEDKGFIKYPNGENVGLDHG